MYTITMLYSRKYIFNKVFKTFTKSKNKVLKYRSLINFETFFVKPLIIHS